MATVEQLHEIGVLKHGSLWLAANMRAVEALWETKLKVDSVEVKEAIPLIILRVLDAARNARGQSWDGHKWVKR